MSEAYDLILFGVTGFTGKLCAEYLFEKNYGAKWAVSARNKAKTETILQDLISSKFPNQSMPDILVADLVCTNDEQEEILRNIVRQTKVVLTCSGPFEKYCQTLVKLCAELGVDYADITGETDFVRQNITKHDKTAQETGAVILSHCGNDCIPCDLLVYEMNEVAKKKGCELQKVMAYEQFSEGAAFSGGTATTAAFQLSKDRTKPKTSFDPLLANLDGNQSDFSTKNISPKGSVPVPGMTGYCAGPWVMGPVMVNCVRRSNALLGYSKEFQFGDSMVAEDSWTAWIKRQVTTLPLALALTVPSLFGGLLPKPGEGPDREVMENGYLKLHGQATMSGDKNLKGLFHFKKDTGYLYTAVMLVETGMVLLEKHGSLKGGCQTPASALGGDLTKRILGHMDVTLEIEEV